MSTNDAKLSFVCLCKLVYIACSKNLRPHRAHTLSRARRWLGAIQWLRHVFYELSDPSPSVIACHTFHCPWETYVTVVSTHQMSIKSKVQCKNKLHSRPLSTCHFSDNQVSWTNCCRTFNYCWPQWWEMVKCVDDWNWRVYNCWIV